MDNRRWSMMDGNEPVIDHRVPLRPARGPVLQPLKKSLQPIRRRLDSGGDAQNGGEKQPLQLWQILQDERDSHQKTQGREKHLQTQVNQLKEELEKLKRADVGKPSEREASLSADRLQTSVEQLQSQLAELQRLSQTQDKQLVSQDETMKQLIEQIATQDLQHSSLQKKYSQLQQVKNKLDIKVEEMEKRLLELQNKLVLKENEAEESNLLFKQQTNEELEMEREKLKEIFDTLQTEIELKRDLKAGFERLVLEKDEVISQKDTELRSQGKQLVAQSATVQNLTELVEKLKFDKEQLRHQLEQQDEAWNKRARDEENTLQKGHDKTFEEQEQKYLDKISELEEIHQKQQVIIAKQAESLSKKDAELRIENTKLQFIEEKVNQFDIKLTNQIQELQDQNAQNEHLQSLIEERDGEINFIMEKLCEQSNEIEDKNQKLIVLDMLEEELQQKNALILEKDHLLIDVESIKADCSQLRSEAERVKEELVETARLLEEKDAQYEELHTSCQYQLQQQKEQLLLQYKLESRLQEQILHLERNQIEIDEKNKQLESLETLQEEIKQKDLQILNKVYKLQVLQSLQEKLEIQDCRQRENEQEIIQLNARADELKSQLQIAEELKNALLGREKQLEEDVEFLGQKVGQLELNLCQREATIQAHEDELSRSNSYSLELMKKQQVANDALRAAEEEILDLKNQVSVNLVELQEKNQLFKTLYLQIKEKDTEIENVRISLVCLTQEKQELSEKIEKLNKFIEEQGKDIDMQDQSLQKQDRLIQRLQQSHLQLEQDLQLHQQDSLRQHQDLIEDYIQAKDILEQQLLKQNLLLQQQDLQLHQQDEKLQEINQKHKFYSWGGKKK